jgi:hypothetical protein
MEELVEKLGGSMKLLEGERVSIEITEDETADQRLANGRCLIGRFMSDRRIQKEAFRAFMARLWKTASKVVFKELQDNMWLIEFASEADKRRVLEGCPWLFDRSVLILKEVEENIPPAQMDFSKSPFWIQVHDIPLICMNKHVGLKIGESIGRVEEVDVTGEGIGWGRCLRIRVQVDITKPLERGRALELNGKMVWANLRYEKLPHFCFSYGRIFHKNLQCNENRYSKQGTEPSPKQWGTWLRAEDMRFNHGYSRHGGRRGGSPADTEETNRREGAAGGNSGTKSQSQEGRGATSDFLGTDSNIERSADSLEDRNEKKILQTILGRVIGDSETGEIGQKQSQSRRCDFMELMLTEDQVAKVDYPVVVEGDRDKATKENQGDDHMVGAEQVGLDTGPGGQASEAPTHATGPEPLTESQMDCPPSLSEEDKNEENLLGDGPIRKWRRKARASAKAPELQKAGKRSYEEAVLSDGVSDYTEQVKKGRVEAEEAPDMAWAEAGHQPRRPQ